MPARPRPAPAEPTGKDFSRVMPSAIISRTDPTDVRCRVAGFAACRLPLSQLPSLRQQIGPLQNPPLAASFFKNADEQTVAAMAALGQAIRDHGLEPVSFKDWGVIAAPRFLGRVAMAGALTRFAAEGAWGISPHLIPHRSLHSLSGTISQALKIHGPNYGAGGGPDGADEALLVASALVADGQLPGVWLVLTGFDPELVPVDPLADNAAPPETECVAVALALRPAQAEDGGPCLVVGPGPAADGTVPFSLENLAAALGDRVPAARWALRCGGWAAWELAASPVEACL
jgi:hypothetical protein